jgi:hypothetical protein
MDFSVYSLSPDTVEAKWSAIRNIRDRKLQECDWTQLSDVSLSADAARAWVSYRQALRNIPQDFGSPDDVVFPDPPIS